MRSVWRILVRDEFVRLGLMRKIYNDLYGFMRMCLPNHAVRNVLHASALGSVEPLGLPLGHLAAKAAEEIRTASG